MGSQFAGRTGFPLSPCSDELRLEWTILDIRRQALPPIQVLQELALPLRSVTSRPVVNVMAMVMRLWRPM